MTPVFRFAPSPNGHLHLGHAYSALLNAALARATGGRLLVRIEDIDTTRCTPELTQDYLGDLAWLGLRWEAPVRVQSRHFGDYAGPLAGLRERGLMYPCFCTRQEIARAAGGFDPDGAPRYGGRCRALSPDEIASRRARGEPHGWRLRMDTALAEPGPPLACRRFDPATLREEVYPARPRPWGDVILSRKETPTSYHLSVVVDDALQGVTHVVRGQDLEAATGLHALLQRLLGLPSPVYHHHALLRDEEGAKLSKSAGHRSLRAWREDGFSAAEIRRRLGFPDDPFIM